MIKKLEIRNYRVAVVVAIFVFIFFPALASASDFFFNSTSEPIYSGDTFIVQLKLSTTDNLINAVEGYLSFDNNKLEVKEISAGGSIFSLWPQPAVVLNETGEISFVGGVMGGFQGANAEILKIIFLAKNNGIADVDFEKYSLLFLNDGNGTKTSYTVKPFKLSILERPAGLAPKDEWQPLLKQDTNPPEPFELIVDKSNFVFDGDYFVSFFSTDKESGVDYYEIKEGSGSFVKANSPYRLKDQSLRGIIEVKAVDKAGNERMSVLQPQHPEKIYQKLLFYGIIVVSLVLLFLGGFIWRKKRGSSIR
ncbi:MAG: cohesin domain-containing protein [Patescibacteria group bacterium]